MLLTFDSRVVDISQYGLLNEIKGRFGLSLDDKASKNRDYDDLLKTMKNDVLRIILRTRQAPKISTRLASNDQRLSFVRSKRKLKSKGLKELIFFYPVDEAEYRRVYKFPPVVFLEKYLSVQQLLRQRAQDLSGANSFIVIGQRTNLEFAIPSSSNCLVTDWNNFPSFEYFTSPIASSVNGNAYIDIGNLSRSGASIKVNLIFENGQLQNSEDLPYEIRSIVQAHDCMDRVGEVGIVEKGISTIEHPMGINLIDENLDHSFHVALGQAYTKTLDDQGQSYLLNHSTFHIDLASQDFLRLQPI